MLQYRCREEARYILELKVAEEFDISDLAQGLESLNSSAWQAAPHTFWMKIEDIESNRAIKGWRHVHGV
jgi:hypothetical protein